MGGPINRHTKHETHRKQLEIGTPNPSQTTSITISIPRWVSNISMTAFANISMMALADGAISLIVKAQLVSSSRTISICWVSNISMAALAILLEEFFGYLFVSSETENDANCIDAQQEGSFQMMGERGLSQIDNDLSG
jgi:hypothetical protein